MVGSHVAETVQMTELFMAVFSFGIVLDLPKKYLGWLGMTGGVCWLVYLLTREETGSLTSAAFLSDLSAALLEHILARTLRAFVSVFLIPGILPLVPRTSIHNCVYNIIRNSREQSTYYPIETIQIAGAIAMAMFLMDSMFKTTKNKDKNRV